MDSYMQRETLKLEELKKQGRVVTEVTDEARALEVSYLEQGDVTMYTSDNLKKRKNLQRDPRLLESVGRWWETCITTSTRATGNGRTEMDELPKTEFFALNKRLHKALMLTYDEAEAFASAEEDWSTDVGSEQTTMTRAAFVSSLLELVDVWTHTTEAAEYCEFLDRLFEVIAEQEKEQTSTRRHHNQNDGDGAPPEDHLAFVPPGGVGDGGGSGGGGGDGDGEGNCDGLAAATVAVALGLRYRWCPVHEIVAFSPSLERWTQPEDEEDAVEPEPASPSGQLDSSPQVTTAQPLSYPDAPANSQADAGCHARGAKKLGNSNATIGTAAPTVVPQRKGMNMTQPKPTPAQKAVAPSGTRRTVPERELKQFSSRPIGEAVEVVADLTGCKMTLRNPLEAAVNAQRAVMALQKWSAEREAAPEGAPVAATVLAVVLPMPAPNGAPVAAAVPEAALIHPAQRPPEVIVINRSTY